MASDFDAVVSTWFCGSADEDMALHTSTALCNRSLYRYKYVLRAMNASAQPCYLDLFPAVTRRPAVTASGDKEWVCGEYGILLKGGETRFLAIPDWSWPYWGGFRSPIRKLHHIQTSSLRAVVHRAGQAQSHSCDVNRLSTITVSATDIGVTDGDAADAEAMWSDFKQQLDANYSNGYVITVEIDDLQPRPDTSQGKRTAIHTYRPPSFYCVDIVVPAETHGLGEMRCVGYRGLPIVPGTKSVIPIPNFCLSHEGFEACLSDGPVELRIYKDTKKDNCGPPKWVGRINQGCQIKMCETAENEFEVSVRLLQKKIVTLTCENGGPLDELVCIGLDGNVIAKIPRTDCSTLSALRSLLADQMNVQADDLQLTLANGDILEDRNHERSIVDAMGLVPSGSQSSTACPIDERREVVHDGLPLNFRSPDPTGGQGLFARLAGAGLAIFGSCAKRCVRLAFAPVRLGISTSKLLLQFAASPLRWAYAAALPAGRGRRLRED